MLVKEEYEDTEYAHLPPFQEHDPETDTSKILTHTKRRLRSCRVSSIDENRQLRFYDEIKQDTGNLSRYIKKFLEKNTNYITFALHIHKVDDFFLFSIASTSSRCSSPRGVTLRIPIVTSAQINALLQQSNKWRLMPESAKSENPPNPSTYYGAIHLTRLFGAYTFF